MQLVVRLPTGIEIGIEIETVNPTDRVEDKAQGSRSNVLLQ